MKITNTEIAKMVAKRGYDFDDALADIDAGRTPEEEELEITEDEVEDMVDAICDGFDEEAEYKSGEMW